jgi:hypothetical protein
MELLLKYAVAKFAECVCVVRILNRGQNRQVSYADLPDLEKRGFHGANQEKGRKSLLASTLTAWASYAN